MYKYCNKNPLGKLEDDCVVRSISCATDRSWDNVYDELSDLAQYNGTLLDKRGFVLWYLESHYKRIPYPPRTVGELAEKYPENIILCTVKHHICCIKYGVIYDTFNPSNRLVETAFIVK
jgi:hypothetical protein